MISRLLRRLGEIVRPPDAPHAAPAGRWLRTALVRWTDRGGAPARLSRAGAHPTDEEIVCLMDGELPPRDAARVRRHLEICWSCRHRRTQVQQTIDAFMADCAESLAQDDGLDGLLDVSRLPRAAVAALHGVSPARPSTAIRAVHVAHALAQRLRAGGASVGGSRTLAVRLGAAAAAACVILFLSTGSPVSARQLMRQADRAERAALDLSPSPVVYQRLQVARRGGPSGSDVTGTWDVWTDVAQRRHRSARVDAGDTGGRSAAERSRGALGSRGVAAAAAATTATATTRTGGGPHTRAGADSAAATDGGSGARTGVDAGASEAAAEDLPDALFAALRAHGADAAWPVSIRSHEQWRADARQPRDSVLAARTDAGEPALLLDTTTADSGDRETVRETAPSAPPAVMASEAGHADDHPDGAGAAQAARPRRAAIIRATLLVRERDWHPIEQRLLLRDDAGTSEFVIREAGFDVVPRASLPVAFFEGDDRTEPRHPMEPRHTAESLRSALPTPADIVTAEVQAMYALHRVGMTAADEIAVHRKPRGVEVVGLTTTDARRRDIVAALSAIPLVRARIRTAEEVIAEMDQAPATEGAPLRFEGAQIEADRLPVQGLAAAPAAMAARATTPSLSAKVDATADAKGEATLANSTSKTSNTTTTSGAANTGSVAVGSAAVGATHADAVAASEMAAGTPTVDTSTLGATTLGAATAGTTTAGTAPTGTASASTASASTATTGTATTGPATADTLAARPPVAGAAANARTSAGAPAIGEVGTIAATSPVATTTHASPASSGLAASGSAPLGPAAPAIASSDGAAAVASGAAPSDRVDQATMRRAREAVQQSLTLLERAWALRRLAEWSRRTNAGDITASTRAMIDAMLRERADAASKALAALDTTVTAVLPPQPPGPAPSSPTAGNREIAPGAGPSSLATPAAVETAPAATAPAATTPAAAPAPAASAGPARAEADADRPWADIATDFFGIAAEIDRDTRRLFTATAADSGTRASRPEDDARRLRSGLDAAARSLDALQRARPQ